VLYQAELYPELKSKFNNFVSFLSFIVPNFEELFKVSNDRVFPKRLKTKH
jgi:hypothetical protein